MDSPSVVAAPDLQALKAQQQIAWSSGDYAIVGTTLQIVGETLCEALDLRPGMRVLERGWLSSNNVLFIGSRSTALVDSGYATHAAQTVALVPLGGIGNGMITGLAHEARSDDPVKEHLRAASGEDEATRSFVMPFLGAEFRNWKADLLVVHHPLFLKPVHGFASQAHLSMRYGAPDQLRDMVLAEPDATAEQRVDRMYRSAFARPPTAATASLAPASCPTRPAGFPMATAAQSAHRWP